jgi:hypothetical protein
MSTCIVVRGSAENSAHVQRTSGRGPLLTVKAQLDRSTRGVGPLESTGKSSVRYWPGGSRRAVSSFRVLIIFRNQGGSIAVIDGIFLEERVVVPFITVDDVVD